MAAVTRILQYVRNNKTKSVIGASALTLCIGSPIYVYNARINPVVVATAVERSGLAALTVVSAAVYYKYMTWNWLDKTTAEYEAFVSPVHSRIAESLCRMCATNGGLFIKIGQHLGSLEYLLPKEYTSAFRVLHNQAPVSSIDSVKKVIKAELGADVEDIFTEFEETPLGSASLAQVHRAVLKDGEREVAVKVQHSTVRAHSKVDTITIEFLTKAIDKIFPEFEFNWLIETIKRNLPKELDFVQEGQNSEHLSRLFVDIDFLHVPRIHWDYTNRRVLTMEYCRGGKVDDVEYMKEHNININIVLSHLSKVFSQMIFTRGYIHCDPHPGNVLVRKNGFKTTIVLLDHGLYQTLTDEFRIAYCKLWQGLLSGDKDLIKKQARKLGVEQHYGLFACMVASRTWKDITEVGVADHKKTLDVSHMQAEAVRQIPQISQVLNFIPRQLLLILKTNDLLRGIETTLLRTNTQGVGTFLNMARYCLLALAEHRLKKSTSFSRSFSIYFNYTISLIRLKLYKIIYYITLTRLGQNLKGFLPSNVAI